VIGGYLRGEVELLQEFCSPEMVERLTGIIAALKAQGQTPDPTILHTSEVQLVDVKFLEGEPIVVVQFACQQINCVRDSFGNVVEGAADEIQQVHYAWALQQEAHGLVDERGQWRPPRWQLREMLIRGAVPLL
jgi:mitochondrial import inner membrane translocase subunit TIM44